MQFEVHVTTQKSVAEAAAAVEAALAERKFGVLWHLNVNEKLAEKGVSLTPEFRILEVCNPMKAKEAMETNPDVAYFLPCKVVVRNVAGTTEIGLARPTMLMTVLGDARLEGLAAEVEATMRQALEAAR